MKPFSNRIKFNLFQSVSKTCIFPFLTQCCLVVLFYLASFLRRRDVQNDNYVNVGIARRIKVYTIHKLKEVLIPR